MKIPHLTRNGSFRPQMREVIATLKDCDFVEISLTPAGGYKGEVKVTIGNRKEAEFEAAIDLADTTRFPARIRATATELRDQGFSGAFRVSHDSGLLKIHRLLIKQSNDDIY